MLRRQEVESDPECPQPFIFNLQSLNHINLVQHLFTHKCTLLLERMQALDMCKLFSYYC